MLFYHFFSRPEHESIICKWLKLQKHDIRLFLLNVNMFVASIAYSCDNHKHMSQLNFVNDNVELFQSN